MSIYKREDMVLFWGGDYEHATFSQWARFNIVVGDLAYSSCEQYMMSEKAKLFGDTEIRMQIMQTHDPSKQKQWGRQVKGFNIEAWNAEAKLIVYRGNFAKFTQHADLRAELMNTGYKRIVEASPYDKVWGIGHLPESDDCLDTDKWQGTNWLGDCIQKVREDIRILETHYKFGLVVA